MRKIRLLAAALCAVILLCGFSVTAYAYTDEPAEETGGTEMGAPAKSDDFVGKGGATERADFGGDAPEGAEAEFVPTWEGLDPAEALPLEQEENAFTPSGTGTVVDNATDGDGKEFFTITTPAENVFYLIIDRQRETENVYFLNAVTEADLLALAELPEETVTPTPEPEAGPDPDPTPEQPEAGPETGGNSGTLLLVLAVALIGGGAAWYFKVYRPKKQRAAAPEEDYDESDPYDGPEDYGDEAPWDEDGEQEDGGE